MFAVGVVEGDVASHTTCIFLVISASALFESLIVLDGFRYNILHDFEGSGRLC